MAKRKVVLDLIWMGVLVMISTLNLILVYNDYTHCINTYTPDKCKISWGDNGN